MKFAVLSYSKAFVLVYDATFCSCNKNLFKHNFLIHIFDVLKFSKVLHTNGKSFGKINTMSVFLNFRH